VGDRRVSLDEDTLRFAVVDQLTRGITRVHEYLVHLRRDRGAPQEVLHVGLQEVRYSDGPDLARPVGVFERAPNLAVPFGVVPAAEVLPRLRTMDQYQIEVVQAHRHQRFVDGGDRAVVILDLSGKLGGHEQLLARHPTGADTFADAALVTVCLSRVDIA